MPLIDVKCKQCGSVVKDYYVTNTGMSVECPVCAGEMEKLISRGVHNQIDTSVDGVDIGKNIQEKNEQLKKIHAGYSYEEAALRERTEKFVQDKMEK